MVDVENPEVVIDHVVQEVMTGGGREEVKSEIDIEEMTDVIMSVEMIIVLVVVLREGIEGQIEETVRLGKI